MGNQDDSTNLEGQNVKRGHFNTVDTKKNVHEAGKRCAMIYRFGAMLAKGLGKSTEEKGRNMFHFSDGHQPPTGCREVSAREPMHRTYDQVQGSFRMEGPSQTAGGSCGERGAAINVCKN